MVFTGMHAGREGVQSLDPVCQTLIDQEFQRAVGHGRLVAESLGDQAGQHVIGSQRPMLFQKYLQDPPPDRGHPRALGGGQRLGPGQGARVVGQMPARLGDRVQVGNVVLEVR